MALKKILFLDRDGCLIHEPEDEQVDAISKVKLMDEIIPSLLRLKSAGFQFVMVTNQDGLGTERFPEKDFKEAHEYLMELFSSQGIEFEDVLVCPHFKSDGCTCRKPHLGMVRPYLTRKDIDWQQSAMVGDRDTDLELAANMGIEGYQIGLPSNSRSMTWPQITSRLLERPRIGTVSRKTKETEIEVIVNLDSKEPARIQTGIGFFDHMLEQLAKHSGVFVQVNCSGDLKVDQHHTVEDVAIALGSAINEAAGDKWGMNRYGFSLPMDESRADVSLDFGGRAYFKWEASVPAKQVGEMDVEMVPHFFRSLSESMEATLHIRVEGENSHHMIESSFKGFARSLRMALEQTSDQGIASTKGVL